MTTIYLIRHGESWPNVRPIIGGMKGDEGLTPLGIRQAEKLRDRLAQSREIAADVLIASTLPRARQTAEIIQPGIGLPIIFDDDVQELRMGDADGMSGQQFVAAFGVPDFRNYPQRPVATGGESWGAFMVRVATSLDRIAETHAGKTIVVVCHGGIIDGSLIYFFGLSGLQLPQVRFYTKNTSLTCWSREDGNATKPDPDRRWRLEFYNDAAHLIGTEASESLSWTSMPSPEEAVAHPAVPLPTEEPKDENRG